MVVYPPPPSPPPSSKSGLFSKQGIRDMFVQYSSQGLCFKQTSADDTGASVICFKKTQQFTKQQTNMCLFEKLMLFMYYALDVRK
jgi:hypothetical protein